MKLNDQSTGRILLGSLLLAVLSVFPITVFAGEQTAGKTDQLISAKMNKEMMDRWQKYATPGAEHDRLAKTAGKWKTEIKMWMDPSAPPSISKGTSDRTMVLDGHYLEITYSAIMGGMDFKGMGILGFDKFKEMYTMTWMDNMGTAIGISYGKADPKTNEIILRGKADEPMTGEKDKDIQYIIRSIDEDHFVFEMYDTIQGKLEKVGEIAHERIK